MSGSFLRRTLFSAPGSASDAPQAQPGLNLSAGGAQSSGPRYMQVAKGTAFRQQGPIAIKQGAVQGSPPADVLQPARQSESQRSRLAYRFMSSKTGETPSEERPRERNILQRRQQFF